MLQLSSLFMALVIDIMDGYKVFHECLPNFKGEKSDAVLAIHVTTKEGYYISSKAESNSVINVVKGLKID